MWWARMENLFKKYDALSAQMGPSPDRPCAGKHMEHLCSMAARADFQKVATLTGKPEFVCMNCGRVADAAHNLCNPMVLSAIKLGFPHIA